MRGSVCGSLRNTDRGHKRRGTGHEGRGTILGLDVHVETISVAVAEGGGEVRSLGTTACIPHHYVLCAEGSTEGIRLALI